MVIKASPTAVVSVLEEGLPSQPSSPLERTTEREDREAYMKEVKAVEKSEAGMVTSTIFP